MSDLPIPVPETNASEGDQSTRSDASIPGAAGVIASDPKTLLAQATNQVDEVVQRTETDPFVRAEEIHRIKVEYIKARFQIEAKSKQ